MAQGPQTGGNELDKQRAQAADPATSAAELYSLTSQRPDLRPLIAEHPNAYPGLIQWLASLNDPDVAEALRRRGLKKSANSNQTADASESDAATRPISTVDNDQATRPIASPAAEQATRPIGRTAPQHPAAAQYAATPNTPTTADDQPTEFFSAVQEPYPQAREAHNTEEMTQAFPRARDVGPAPYRDPRYVGSAQHAAPPAAGMPPGGGYPAPERRQEPSRPRRRGGGACVMIVLLVLVLVAALAAAYAILPNSVVDNIKDRLGFGDDTQVEQTEEEQAQQQPEEESEPDQEEDAEDEDELARPAPTEAASLDSFSAPSGNISCQMNEGEVACTVLEYDFEGPDGCDGPVTVRVSTEADPVIECSSVVDIQETALDYDLSAANDVFACESTFTHVECWSQQSGNGFVLAREHVTTQ